MDLMLDYIVDCNNCFLTRFVTPCPKLLTPVGLDFVYRAQHVCCFALLCSLLLDL